MGNVGNVAAVFPNHAKPDSDSYPGHPATRAYLKEVGADPIFLPDVDVPDILSGTLLNEVASGIFSYHLSSYDRYILAGSGTAFAAPIIKARHSNSSITLMTGGHGMFGKSEYQFGDGLLETTRQFDRTLYTGLIYWCIRNSIDEVLAASDLIASRIHASDAKTDVHVFYPYLPESKTDLSSISPNHSSPQAVFIGEHREHKGVNILVDLWPQVRQEQNNAELHIIGSGHPIKYEETRGVKVRGYLPTDDLRSVMSESSLYIHPARKEGFGVSVIEAMSAGLIPIVTSTTGSHRIVRRINEDLVVDPCSRSLLDGIRHIFSLPVKRKKRLSKLAKEKSREFDKDTQLSRYLRKFRSSDITN